MIRNLLRSLVVGFTVATAAVTASASAATLSYDNILGNWCGVTSNPNLTNYFFTNGNLTVTFLPGRTTSTLTVDHYEFSDSTVVLFYLAASPKKGGTPGNTLVQVTFENFSPDGQTMNQRPSEQGGLYRFVRCGRN